jgi:hypothetical protein
MEDGASQFQNFGVNFHKFHALFSTRLSQTRLPQALRKMTSENADRCAQMRKMALVFQSDTTKMAMNFSITSFE